ncbi:MAG: hypothetical protein WC755_00125 [Candidatus Woesearchaeota archaeon]|jgi:hypothetical protein
MKKILTIILLVLVSALLFGCAVTKVADIKKEDMIGKTVSIHGTVKSTFKLGSLSGYTMTMEDGELLVSSKSLPAEGKEMSVKGVVMKDSIIQYYIKANE